MVVGLQEREWLRDMFGRFVSPEVVEAMRSGRVQLEGENRVVTALFCDIRGYTARSETLTPREIVQLLNEFRSVLVEAVQRHHGSVNQFSGDGAFVIFGAPNALEDSARCAILAALDFRQGLAALNERLVSRGGAPIRIGVGINTGPVVAGAFGPRERLEYSVIGDPVNLASRIEALNKQYPEHDILISEYTCQALGEGSREFALVPLGPVAIRGKAEAVEIFAVIGRNN
jgi:adenylate cyclase